VDEAFERVSSCWVPFNFVNDLLNFNRVALGLVDLLRISEGDVLKTMDFTEAPEHRISILTAALNLEHLAQVKFLEGVEC
jgi:hypothetical protein